MRCVRSATGDPSIEARLEALLQEHGALVHTTIARLVPAASGIAREDVGQEARLRLWRALERGTEIQRPASFIYRVAATAALDALRRAHVRREQPLETSADDSRGRAAARRLETVDGSASPEAIAAGRELERKVEAALGKLVENRRAAVELHLQGLSVPEVARLMGWTDPKARKLVYRGLEDLRRGLREKGIRWTAN